LLPNDLPLPPTPPSPAAAGRAPVVSANPNMNEPIGQLETVTSARLLFCFPVGLRVVRQGPDEKQVLDEPFF
jgi:hypothetical protein